jgi:poly-gamma-glutamate synthesis protein (capsule biosynthesis protein)
VEWREQDRRRAQFAERRRRQRQITVRRRRVAAIGIFLVVLIAAVLAIAGDLGGGSGNPKLTAALRRAEARAQRVKFTVEASGDLLIHSPVWERAQTLAGGSGYDFAPMFDQIKPYIEGASLALCHMETPMTSAPPTSYPIFNTPPELAKAVAQTGWDACDTASNHSLDQGQDGIDQTGKTFDGVGIPHDGSFPSPAAQRKPVIIKVHGKGGDVKLGFLAFTTDTNGIPSPHPWSVNIAKPDLISEQVKRDLKAGADAVVVNLHWGGGIVAEYEQTPSSGQVALAKKVTAMPGVAAIVAQGPHVVQPIRWVNGKPVVYSEGNLISNQSPLAGLPATTQDGLIALISFVAEGGKVEAKNVHYVPTWVSIPSYEVLPVGPALAKGSADATELRDSYQRTTSVAGRGPKVEPVPAKLSGG